MTVSSAPHTEEEKQTTKKPTKNQQTKDNKKVPKKPNYKMRKTSKFAL